MRKKDFSEKPMTELACQTKSELGFSLIEAVVAMVIFLIVTASVFGLLKIGRLDRNRASDRADIMKNARTDKYRQSRRAERQFKLSPNRSDCSQ